VVVGHIKLETAEHKSLGHETPLFKKDFNNNSEYWFQFNHVADGDYLIQFWTDRYVNESNKVTMAGQDKSANLAVTKGASLTGKLVNDATGEAVTAKDGVTVICEAVPFLEGSRKATREEKWSISYIEDDTGLSTGNTGGTQGQRVNATPGKFHLTGLPAGSEYVILVKTVSGASREDAKNYIGRLIAGLNIPPGATGEIDVGTIRLREGTTISGRITTEVNGVEEGVPGVEVMAVPSDKHDGSMEVTGVSDTRGFYTIYGIDPKIEHYDLMAAKRPWLFEDWGKIVEWSEKRRYNIRPANVDTATGRTIEADFIVTRASASMYGTITIPSFSRFMLPFTQDNEAYPASYILLKKKGVTYKDMLDGIEGLSAPRPESAVTAEYRIDNIEPGTYMITYMNWGLPRAVIDNVVIESGEKKEVNLTWDSTFFTLSGVCALSDGGYPSTSDISGVLCLNTIDHTVTFGRLTLEADNTISSYSVPGLVGGETYQLIFYKASGLEEMPFIFAVGDVFTMTDADMAYDAAITRNPKPVLTLQAFQTGEDKTTDNDSLDAGKIQLGIFSTVYLSDNEISVVAIEPTADTTGGSIYLKKANGILSDVKLATNKRKITATYAGDPSDREIEIVLAVHYGQAGSTLLTTFTFDADDIAINSDIVSLYTSEQIKLGHGDNSQLYIPAGAMESHEGRDVAVQIIKSESDASSGASTRHLTARALSSDTLEALPGNVTQVSAQYEFNAQEVGTNDSPDINEALTVQLEFDPVLVSNTDNLNIWHYTDEDQDGNRDGVSAWKRETLNRKVDGENNTIAVEVKSLDTFVVGEESFRVVGSGDSKDCFIRVLLR